MNSERTLAALQSPADDLENLNIHKETLEVCTPSCVL